MKILESISAKIALFEQVILSLGLAVMIVLAFLQVIMRDIFDSGMTWADPFVRYLVLWVGFLGAAIATHEGHHINIDVFSRFIPEKFKPILFLVIHTFATIVSSILSWAAFRFVMMEKANGAVAFLSIPLWAAEAVVPVAFALVALRFFIKCAGNVCEICKGGDK